MNKNRREEESVKKHQLSCTIDHKLNALLEAYVEMHHISSKSTALNVILQTWFKEDWQSRLSLPLKNSIMIPKEIFMELKSLNPYSVKMMEKKGELKEIKILDCPYVCVQYKPNDIIVAKFDETFGTNQKFQLISQKIDQVMELLGVKTDVLGEFFEKYKETESYQDIFNTTYLLLIKDIRNKSDNPIEYLNTIPKDKLLGEFNTTYSSAAALEILNPFVAFLYESI